MTEEEFIRTCNGPKILKKIPQLFKKGLGFLPEKEREIVELEKSNFTRLVCLEFSIIKVIRESVNILREKLSRAGYPYYFGE